MTDALERRARDDALAGALAGAACVCVGHPFDTVKTRAQDGTARGGTLRAVRVMYASSGVRGFYAGVGSPLIGASAETGLNYAAFHATRTAALDARGSGASGVDRLLASAFAGGFAGALLCGFITPFELVKCRAQVGRGDGRAWRAARECYAEGGVRGMFRGFTHTLVREIPSGVIYFSAYEVLQSMVPRPESSTLSDVTKAAFARADGLGLAREAVAAVACGGGAGAITWLAILPLDNVKTIYQCERPGGPMDLPPLALLRRLVAERGVAGLWRGATPIVARAFPANAAQWLTFEFVSRALHDRRATD